MSRFHVPSLLTRVSARLKIGRSAASSALEQRTKRTVSFFARGNVFLQLGRYRTEREVERKMRRPVRLDYSDL